MSQQTQSTTKVAQLLAHLAAHAGAAATVETVHESGWVNVSVAGCTFWNVGDDVLFAALPCTTWQPGQVSDTVTLYAADLLARLSRRLVAVCAAA